MCDIKNIIDDINKYPMREDKENLLNEFVAERLTDLIYKYNEDLDKRIESLINYSISYNKRIRRIWNKL